MNRSIVVLGWMFLYGCASSSVRYAEWPAKVEAQTPAQECFAKDNVQVTKGTVNWTESYSGYGYTTTYFFKADGLAFFKGRQPVKPGLALSILPDRQLDLEYHSELSALKKKNITKQLLFWGGYGTMLAAIAPMTLWAMNDVAGDGDTFSPMFFGWVVPAAVGMIATLTSIAFSKDARRYRAYKDLYVESKHMPQVVKNVDVYNQRLANRCGYTGPRRTIVASKPKP